MATIGKLLIEIGATTEGLKKGLDKSASLVSGATKSLGGLAKNLGGPALAAAGTAAAGIALVGGVALNTASDIDVATGQIAAGLSISKEAASEFEDEMLGVFANNFGADFEDIAATLVTVEQGLKNLPDDELQAVAEGALAIRDNFEKEVPETIDAAAVLMEEFGLTGQESLDFIAAGFQKGLNRNDDFLDSVREYGNLFGDADFTADQFFSTLETGLEGGVLGTDKIADAVKEFNIRFLEGGAVFKDFVAELTGDDYDMFLREIETGHSSVADVFGLLTTKLAEIEDPIKRNAMQIELFGTQAEDLGVSFTEGLDLASTSLEEMAGATDALNAKYDNLPNAVEGFQRRAQVALAPVGETLLNLVNEALPSLNEFFEVAAPVVEEFAGKLAEKLPEVIDRILAAAERLGKQFELIDDNVTGVDAAAQGLSSTLDGLLRGVELVADLAEAVADLAAFMERAHEIGPGFFGVIGALGENLLGLNQDADIPGYARGGVVPGPIGAPQLAMVHGGETIIPVGGQMGGQVIVNIDGVSATAETNGDANALALEMTMQMLARALESGG